jgi:hypothetical protein
MEGLETTSTGDDAAVADPVGCDWSSCKTSHSKKLEYPGGGNVDKNGNATEGKYRDRWIARGMQPWVITGGLPRIKLESSKKEPGKVKVHHNQNDYMTQGHHLIRGAHQGARHPGP